MSLRRRLLRLEAARGQDADPASAAAFVALAERLDALARQLHARGDLDHARTDSPASNVARAFARGDAQEAMDLLTAALSDAGGVGAGRI